MRRGSRAGRPRLASRLLLAESLVVIVGAVTPALVSAVIAPPLFHEHLMQAGSGSDDLVFHAETAFRSALGISVGVGAIMSAVAAGLISWFLVRRIAAPVEALAAAADQVATGRDDVTIPNAAFSHELQSLADAFLEMTGRLSASDATRTRMLADLAHEVRTPLATLRAYIDGVEDGVIAIDSTTWSTMRHQLDRVQRLASDLRDVANAEEQALTLTLVDGAELTRLAVSAHAARFMDRAVALHFQLDSSAASWMVHADSMRLQQVLANLLDNALRHTPAGGQVEVIVERTSDRLVVRVQDNGEGIAAEQLETIFQRFHRADPSRATDDGSGSGLGLTIARALVSAHGGTLQAHSAGIGHGAEFVMEIPLAANSA